ncbi:YwmB family TATA-box binding protein [Pueribacillus theae]|uniref:YwmB family TATA-box binding protein n=1 Tax=Pueribacillus theae TaxID=2171751 RepID=UPI0014031040|nr:YwmB family TATA-box binding protein [Pueribacillus theae]
MKKIGLISLVLFIIAMVHHTYKTDAKHMNPLDDMAKAMDELKIEMTGWTMTAKENSGFESDWKGYKSRVDKLHNKTLDFTWGKPEYKGETIIVKGTKKSKDGNITETLTISTHRLDEHYYSVLSYSMTGKRWSEKVKNDAFSLFSTRTSELFSSNPSFFSCISGKINDTMVIALSKRAEQIIHKFDADFVEGIHEETFVSLSAYTELWQTSLETKEKKMNLQIALRNKGKNTPVEVLIGTPILLNEY